MNVCGKQPPCYMVFKTNRKLSALKKHPSHRSASASFSSRYRSASAGFLTLASSSFSLRVISCSWIMICCERSTTNTCIFSSSILLCLCHLMQRLHRRMKIYWINASTKKDYPKCFLNRYTIKGIVHPSMHFFLLLNTIKILYFVDDQFWFPLTSMVLFCPYNGGHWEPKLLVTNYSKWFFKESHTGLEGHGRGVNYDRVKFSFIKNPKDSL